MISRVAESGHSRRSASYDDETRTGVRAEAPRQGGSQRRKATRTVPGRIRPGDLIAGRYVVADLLDETGDGWFWRAEDPVLGRHVAVHVVSSDDPRAQAMLEAARLSVTVHDRRILRVLDGAEDGDICYVVNEWGDGTSLDIKLARDGTLDPRRAAWIVSEVASVIAVAHDAGVAHGRLAPENVLIDQHGEIRVIGFAVEAALWGLPPGRLSADLTDLGALLYAGLTGRWAGVSRSSLPSALEHGGRVLRPRKVRAGVPRVLDDVCDEILNAAAPGAGHAKPPYDVTSARGLHEVLAAFVGDPTGLAVGEQGRPLPLPEAQPVDSRTDLVPVPAAPEADLETSPESNPGPDPGPAVATGAGPSDATLATVTVPTPATAEPAEAEPPEPGDQPTQAGIPVFDDEGVGWVSLHREEAAPPPPFEEPPERPLFAPAPAEGEPVRRTRPGVVTPSEDYWPWDASQAGRHTGTQPGVSTTGHGLAIIEDEEDDQVPGRTWMRLAYVVAAVTLLGVGMLVAWYLAQGRVQIPFDGSTPTTEPTTGSDTVAVVPDLTARDFDPQGSDGEEHPETVARAVDGDPETTWQTNIYKQQLGPSGLKRGVGVVVDLGAARDVRRVVVDLVGAPTGVSLFLTDTDPEDLAGLSPVARDEADARFDAELEATGRYLVVWLTSLPAVDGGFRGGIADIVVRATAPAADGAAGTERSGPRSGPEDSPEDSPEDGAGNGARSVTVTTKAVR